MDIFFGPMRIGAPLYIRYTVDKMASEGIPAILVMSLLLYYNIGHVLPKLNQHTHNYTSINQHHHHRHTPSSPKLISLPEESSQVSATNSSNKDKNRVFQPIAVPSI